MKNNHKVCIVTRVFFPASSPRANRSTFLAIELANQGYDVTVYGLLGSYDYTEFCKRNSLKVKNLGKSYLGNGDSDTGRQKTGFFFRLIKKLIGKKIMFPEFEISYLIFKKKKEITQFDSIISIAAPFAVHFGIGLLDLEKKTTWISDCGDPFIKNPFEKYPAYFKRIEMWWAKKTTYITVPFEKARSAYPTENQDKIHIIPQGFPIIKNLDKNYVPNKIVTFAYSGNVYPVLRDPTGLLNHLSSIGIEFKFIVYTKTPEIFLRYKKTLGERLEIKEFIERENLLNELSRMDFLININNNSDSQLPSKLIDYAMCRRPVINISSCISKTEINRINEFLNGKFDASPVLDCEQYNIQKVTKQFASLFNR